MSVEIMSRIWRLAPFKETKLLVLLALADAASDEGACWPSVATIARKARCSDRWAQNCIAELIGEGWLERESRPGRSSLFTVLTPEPQFTPEESAGVNPSSPHPRTPVHPGVNPSSPRTIKEPSRNHQAPVVEDVTTSPPARAARSWEPHPSAVARATSNAQVLDVGLHIDHYLVRCRMREKEPTNEEWLTWFLKDEQKARTEATERGKPEPDLDINGYAKPPPAKRDLSERDAILAKMAQP